MKQYAVNVGDMAGYSNDFAVMMMLRPVLTRQTVDAEPGRFDGMGAILEADDPERIPAIVEILRKKIGKTALRIYTSETGKNWKRI